MKPYQSIVLALINKRKPRSILDAPSGSGWLGKVIHGNCEIDGLDLFSDTRTCYNHFFKHDMNEQFPTDCPSYDCIVSCEGLEHLFAPSVFLQSARLHLKPGGMLIITTPNIWYPDAKIQYFLRGFFPSFPNLVGAINSSTHMHITPWSFPQIYLILRLLGFRNITLHQTDSRAPKHFYERILGLPQMLYCRTKLHKADTEETRDFWAMAGSSASLYARGLVVSAIV